MPLVYLFALIFFLSSCRQSKRQVQVFNTNGFVLIDTFLRGNKFLSANEPYSNYPIYFIGSKSDTVKIGSRCKVGETKWSNDKIKLSLRKYTTNNIRLSIDTSIATTSTVEYYSENYKTLDSTKSFKSYLLTLQNISDSSLYLGRSFELYYVARQVKGKSGQWITLDKKTIEGDLCFTGQPTIIIKPKEFVITKFKRYSGKFLTEFRFKIGDNDNVVYSNTFTDFMDERIIQNTLLEK